MLKSMSLMLILLWLLAACNTQPPLPTLAPLEAPSQTPLPQDVLPSQEPSPIPTNTPFVRPTFPPTWTPEPSPTDVPSATPTIVITATPAIPPRATPVACGTFFADERQSDVRFELGRSPRAAWTAVEGAVMYRLFLEDASRQVTLRDDIYIAETSYVFDGTLFREGRLYGWRVYPIDNRGDQMCFFTGLELVPFVSQLPGN